jgi:hypothetical protein
MTYALEEAVELLGVDAVGSLHFAVEPMRARPDADVADAFVDQVPVERGAEPLAVVGLYLVDVEWQLGQHVVDEGDGGDLLVARVGPQDPQSGAVIDRGVLVVAPPAALRPSGSMNLTSACRWWPAAASRTASSASRAACTAATSAARSPSPVQDAPNSRRADRHLAVPVQVHRDLLRPEVVAPAQTTGPSRRHRL